MLTTDIAQRISKVACIPLSDAFEFLNKNEYLTDVFEDVEDYGYARGFDAGVESMEDY